MKQKYIFSTLLLLAIVLPFLLPTVSSVPPFQSGENLISGYEVQVPPFYALQQSRDFKFNIHVYNKSSGMPITNATASCVLHIYLKNGTTVLQNVMPHINEVGVDNEWSMFIDKNNFTTTGTYGYIVQCNSTTLTGFAADSFEVTPTGGDRTNTLGTFIILFIVSTSILGIAMITKNGFVGFISGCLFLVTGVYTMIYGLGNLSDVWTRSVSYVILGMGLIFCISAGYEIIGDTGYGLYSKDEGAFGDDD